MFNNDNFFNSTSNNDRQAPFSKYKSDRSFLDINIINNNNNNNNNNKPLLNLDFNLSKRNRSFCQNNGNLGPLENSRHQQNSLKSSFLDEKMDRLFEKGPTQANHQPSQSKQKDSHMNGLLSMLENQQNKSRDQKFSEMNNYLNNSQNLLSSSKFTSNPNPNPNPISNLNLNPNPASKWTGTFNGSTNMKSSNRRIEDVLPMNKLVEAIQAVQTADNSAINSNYLKELMNLSRTISNKFNYTGRNIL